MPNNKKIGSSIAPYMKQDKTSLATMGSIYIGVVKNNFDPTRAGRLQVYIPHFGSSDETNPQNWITVSYGSPFRGQTKQRIDINTYLDVNIDVTNTAENSFQSYGFWFVPPDLNGRVLCVFANNDLAQGYWIACIQDAMDSHMVPGIGAVTASNGPNDGGYIFRPAPSQVQQNGKTVTVPAIPTHTMLQDYIELNVNGSQEIPFRLPVSEPVVTSQADAGPGTPTQVQMVPQVYQTKQLGVQGLAFDFIRGSTSASSVRENPSQVFGISTPGRLTNFANVALSEALLQQITTFLNTKTTTETNTPNNITTALTSAFRTGGHQFVMDDGSVDGFDQGIRIRTTNGNEILLDDTNGQIYIINSTGNAWVELSPSGFIDIFSNQDFSVRSKGNINLHADKNILMNAGENIQLHSGQNINLDSLADITSRSAGDSTLYSVGDFQIGAGGAFNIDSDSPSSISTSGTLNVKGSMINLNSGTTMPVSDPGALTLNKLVEVGKIAGSQVWWQTGQFNSLCVRGPAHEPWPNHEINGITTFNVKQGTVNGPIIRSQTGTTSSGIRGTQKGSSINETQIAKQPLVGAVCGLTVTETQALMAQIGQRESGGNYGAQNSIGFSGKYQFGAALLETLKFLYPGSSKTGSNLQVINNPANWTGLNGCNSVQDWFNSPSVQEQAMVAALNLNCKFLTSHGVLTPNSTVEARGGFLMAAHLVGPGGALTLYQIQNSLQVSHAFPTSDANGTTAQSYYSLGSNAVQLGASKQQA